MLKGQTGAAVDAAKKGSPYAALDAVTATGAAWREDMMTGRGHGASVANKALRRMQAVPVEASE